LFFISSDCPQLFSCSPLPYRCTGVSTYACNVNKLRQNLGFKPEYDVTNSVYPVTIRHCSLLEFDRGASNQAIAPGITRPLHWLVHCLGELSLSKLPRGDGTTETWTFFNWVPKLYFMFSVATTYLDLCHSLVGSNQTILPIWFDHVIEFH